MSACWTEMFHFPGKNPPPHPFPPPPTLTLLSPTPPLLKSATICAPVTGVEGDIKLNAELWYTSLGCTKHIQGVLAKYNSKCIFLIN